MKDRWKIVIICVVVGSLLSIIFFFVGFSFRRVFIGEYGIVQSAIWHTADLKQDARGNGNFIIGIDKTFIKFPSGIIPYSFQATILTKDKSEVIVQGFFAGKLIQGYINSLYVNYGTNFQPFLQASVEQYFRQALQNFTLDFMIRERNQVVKSVSNYVTISMERKYQWLDVGVISIGSIGKNIPPPIIIPTNFPIQNAYARVLSDTILIKKQSNVMKSGGYQFVQQIENINCQLFTDVLDTLILTVPTNRTSQELLNAAGYALNTPQNAINNTITLRNIKI